MKYRVTGTIELNWENIVEADSEQEALERGASYAEDGMGHSTPVDSPEAENAEPISPAEDL